MTTENHFSHRAISWGSMLCILASLLFVGCGGRGHHSSRKADAPQDTATVYITHEDFNPIVKVYVENSGSMDGYVKGQTEFEDIVYNYLVSMQLAKITDAMQLFYINSDILPQESDVQTFIKQLEPSTFRARGGKRGTTDIAQMISMIMNEMNDSTVSIFVSDCIFSPGRGQNAESYLKQQQISVKKTIGEYFNAHPNFAVVGYRCLSTFDGTYFDKEDRPSQYQGKRPFYIWLFGTSGALRRIQIQLAKNNYSLSEAENEFSAMGTGRDLPDSAYAVKRMSGKFSLDRKDPRHSIQDLKKDPSGKVTFAVEANLASLLMNKELIGDTSCYLLSDPHYKLVSVEDIKEYQKNTHVLKFESDRPYPSRLEVRLVPVIPGWVEVYNDDNGNALNEETAEQTFGIKYLVYGISDAIHRTNFYARMTININK